MKRLLILFVFGVFCINCMAATGRGANPSVRATPQSIGTSASDNSDARTSVKKSVRIKSSRNQSENQSVTRSTRNVAQRTNTAIRQTNKSSTTRSAVPVTKTSVRPARSAKTSGVVQIGRAATTTTQTNTFDPEYTACRDAYFTCMDQFCALQNDTYRRCVCSSKLETIKTRTRAISQTNTQLQDFKDLNISAILKTPAEVNAMLHASEGEATLEKTKDTSASAQKITAVRDVLSGTRSNALTSQGQLDIAGDIKSIWSTTDLALGANIANLTGESLYNAVHAQCSELVSPQCPSKKTLDMVVSAYGIYIENDCATILGALDKQAFTANSAIRETEREMNTSRLENYNAHNSSGINDCIAKVRSDITSDVGCGENYVHCLDLTGLYLSRDTGEPIYSENFYQLNTMLSLSDNVITNTVNAKYISELNNKKRLAQKSLETCRDIADDVWNEFLQQALTEIYQGQHARIRQVKDECLDVVNTCYDETTGQLRDYSKIPDQMLLGDRLELSEEMCKIKLDTCKNLYAYNDGKLDEGGMALLVNEMKKITDQKIAKNCLASLDEYAKNLCKVSNLDSIHSYPYGCRMYMPGNAIYAQNPNCTYIRNLSGKSPLAQWLNTISPSPGYNLYDNGAISPTSFHPNDSQPITYYMCYNNRVYSACKPGACYNDSDTPVLNEHTNSYSCNDMCNENETECFEGFKVTQSNNDTTPDTQYGFYLSGSKCLTCPSGYICRGGSSLPQRAGANCGDDYVGSLYQKMVVYALQYCVRSSQSTQPIPTDILADVNMVMDSIRSDMASVLQSECERLGGEWETIYSGKDEANQHKLFYDSTNADLRWGLCKPPSSTSTPQTSGP